MIPTVSSSVALKLIFIVLISAVVFLVYFFHKTHEQWRKWGVPRFLSPLDDMAFELRKNKSLAIQERYWRLAAHPCGGVWFAGKPYLLVRDPQLVRTIVTKAFSHFVDRGLIMPEDINPLSANLFNLRGERWRNIRIKLVHSFSSAKLKAMYTLMEGCTEVLHRYLLNQLEESPEVEVGDLMVRFSKEVVGACLFSFDCQTIEDAKSVFQQVARKFKPNWVHMGFRETINAISPRIVTWLNWTNIHPDLLDFFNRVKEETIKARHESQSNRKDFMQLLIKAQQEEQKQLSQEEVPVAEPLFNDNTMLGHVFFFFVAGFESTSITLGYCLYELTMNPHIMERFHVEVTQVMAAHGGKLDYEALKKMHFLECIISETLRKYPPVGWLDRICTESFEDPNSSLMIGKDTNIIIPVYALHHDPQYFPEPEKFNPDRFSARNEANIVPGTYLPFGDGPRICVGMRFALMEIKLSLATIARNYTLHPTEKLPAVITFQNHIFFNVQNQGLHIRFQKRAE